jgi:hypothetical protein
MAPERCAAVVVAASLLALLALAFVRQPAAPEPPPRIPASACEAWMADALPGVGAKSREHIAAAIRSGELASLPPRARALARELFDFSR